MSESGDDMDGEVAKHAKTDSVFISYSSKDKAIADAACHTLEQHGIRCWIAPRDVIPGSDWGQSIIDALSDARIVVLIFSRNSNESNEVRNEVLAALESGCVIVPFRIHDIVPAGTFKL